MKKRILIVDDESGLRMLLGCLLEEHGYEVRAAADGLECLEVVGQFLPNLVLLDLEMPRLGGLETLDRLREDGFTGKVIILTAYGTINSAVRAMRHGAYDYITKPFLNDDLLLTLDRALEQDSMELELATARDRLAERFSVSSVITNNSRMLELLQTVKRIAPSNSPVLVLGDSGTGKELIANAIHQHSPRRDKPFIALNCGSLPANLIESELFGYRKGAFSGADASKPGLVEKAHGGTLFLDEVGEMGPEAQVKLLRFAQSGEFYPVGGTMPRRVDVRLLAASNRDLSEAVSSGRFRQDLFYRLNVVLLRIPPLRERIDDIPLLVDHFIRKHGPQQGKGDYRFGSAAMEALQLHAWPGNVRELENAVQGALLMATGSTIGLEDLPLSVREGAVVLGQSRTPENLHELLRNHQELVERKAIAEALAQCGGHQTRAAKRLGIGRTTLMRKMKKHGIK